jgi:FKBP-type peptidyl-prolyl cis-trans isomerase
MTTRTLSLALVLSLLLSLGLGLSGCNGDSESQVAGDDRNAAAQLRAETPGAGKSFSIPSGRDGVPPIRITVVEKGTGIQARAGETVSMHYVGTLPDGAKFDSSRDRGEAFEFRLGQGSVISGWDIIVEHMHVGDRWIANIPSALAYGPRGAGGVIGPNADLVFDMELLRTR